MEVTGGVRFSRIVFFGLAIIFAICVAAQVFLAGLATFVDPGEWRKHTLFVRIFEFIPLLMLIFSFVGRMPKGMRWQSFALFLLIMLMYATANMTSSVPIAGALHPVIALILFWASVSVVHRAWRLVNKIGATTNE